MTPIFLYGTLRHPPLLGAMAEAAGAVAADIAAIPAQLPDHVVRHAGQEVYPQIFAEPGAQAQGILVQADADLCAVLDFYEGAYGYALRPVTVVTADGARSAQVYWPPETIAPGPIWDLAAWVHEWGALTVSSAPDILRLRRAWAATDTRAIRPFAQARGWARQLAQTGAPATVRHSPAPGDVQATPREDGYDGFFGLRRLDLRYRRFSGDLSDPISREAFMAFDAALVLPYDPDRDSVLLVEQLRYGPIVRTDPNPWVLEPVAGLVDAGEDPADTVRREAQEEAGLTLGRVIALPHAYPSPGYSSEYFHMFIAVTDLSGHSTGLGGLEGESEDIRHHVIPRAHALDLIDSGEINALPLQTMLLWLDRMRHQLRD